MRNKKSPMSPDAIAIAKSQAAARKAAGVSQTAIAKKARALACGHNVR